MIGKSAECMTLREQLGQRMAVGFSGTELSGAFLDFLAEYKIGNVILFKRNIESLEQLERLTAQLQKAVLGNTGYPAFIMIDQEGGPIVRLSEEAVNVPGAMAVAATADAHNAYLAGELTGRQLAAAGVNFDIAPSLDINCNPDNPVIGVRSYGDTPEQVAAYGIEMMKGLASEGVVPCVKHFPGHGDTKEDSHLSLPRVDKTEKELWQMELAPFAEAVKEKAPALMSSHVVYPALEPDEVPATMSRRIMTELLRDRLGFEGVTVSDSMEMAAIKAYYGVSEGVLAAIKAGVDIVLISHSMELAAEAIRLLEQAQTELDSDEMVQSVARILSCKVHYGQMKASAKVTGEDHELNDMLLKKTYTAVQLPLGKMPELGEKPFFTSCYAYQSSLVSNEDDKKICFCEWLTDLYGGDALVFSPDPEEEEIEKLVKAAAEHTSIVVGTYNGHLRRGQRELLKRLADLHIPMVVFALRNPYELLELPKHVTAIAVWEYSMRSLRGIRSMLDGVYLPEGRLPIECKNKI